MDLLPTDLSEKAPDFLEVRLEYVVAADVVAQDVLNYYEGSAPGTVYCVAIDVLPPNQRLDHLDVPAGACEVEGVAMEELARAELVFVVGLVIRQLILVRALGIHHLHLLFFLCCCIFFLSICQSPGRIDLGEDRLDLAVVAEGRRDVHAGEVESRR